jgi:hypothetical protein
LLVRYKNWPIRCQNNSARLFLRWNGPEKGIKQAGRHTRKMDERNENRDRKRNKINRRTCTKKEMDRRNKQRNMERKQTCMNNESKRKTKKYRKTGK